ncbi:bifunctional aspartate kinase/homoserine dehydrogenase II [Shewanella sp. NIFS-20-20]|uniref:bifunctional aspartate kinase/homoserine dehydrogenase II n=1 Tax=Shewanella sp. NIFS-20-20 TaxID=2853806 RepID=UPI001C470037|nr:bifunctional aspartate kinase/homoserine dehydrogenase II [Shewanella sp. NIFS-20-20]MBV7315279.1 bifunctional aspartate kinase/homoserine dehydrogenase II [Shewanella sp. NIFS-20-20]
MVRRHLHKFGGSSLADADCYRRVAHILLTHGQSNDLVVVSAAGKTTNKLYQLLDLSQQGALWQEALADLIQYQQHMIEQLLTSDNARELRERLALDKAQIASLLQLDQISHYQISYLVSFGERWSARLMAALLRGSSVDASHVDATQILIADEGVVPQIRMNESRQLVQKLLAESSDRRLVVTGFICSNPQGETLLLGRNGSDFSATLIAALAGINRVTIWTDVEGVFNADPNKISDAQLLSSMTLAEADRLARLGSPVLHERTLQPLFDTNVSLAVRSSYASHTDFTLISPVTDRASAPVVTSLNQICVLSCQLETEADELLSLLPQHGVQVLAHWCQEKQLSLACTLESRQQIHKLLQANAEQCGLSNINSRLDHGLVALVSADAALYRRAFARLLNRSAFALYQDELSLVTLVPCQQVNSLTQKVHRRCAGPRKRIGVILLGTGNIGSAWLTLFAKARAHLCKELQISVDLVGVVSSRSAYINGEGIDAISSIDALDTDGKPWQYADLFSQLNALACDELVALDISASASLTLHYPAFFAQGIHMVSANKLAGSSPLPFYRQLKQQLNVRRLFWRYNASCGAGLPVQHALNDLHNSGDRVEAVGGIFSGTLCWLFEKFTGEQSFSQLVNEAKGLGITEPDPRDDLSGRDMQRKLLILAREIGLPLALDDIELNSLVPVHLQDVSLDEFLSRLSELDAPMAAALDRAQANGEVIRYVASLELVDGQYRAQVGLESVAADHPYANLTAGDNVFVIRSAFYQANPLIIRGPGAGRDVTAAAVQSDLAQICHDLLHE